MPIAGHEIGAHPCMHRSPNEKTRSEIIALGLIEQSSDTGQGRVACRERLGGLLKHYYRETA